MFLLELLESNWPQLSVHRFRVLVFFADLLEKSLKVLTSSGVLQPKLRQLQWIEALQRRGGVLQDVEGQEEVKVCPLSILFFPSYFILVSSKSPVSLPQPVCHDLPVFPVQRGRGIQAGAAGGDSAGSAEEGGPGCQAPPPTR